jgi:DNA-directed RNA polymerase II subunit RPB11
MIRMQLHEDRAIVFAGYRIPHPLESKMLVMIQTNGTKSATQAMEHTLDDLRSEMQSIQSQFDEEARRLGGAEPMQY